MAQFRSPNYADSMSVDECNRIALENAGVLTSRGYGYSCNPSGESLIVNAEWSVRTIDTQGMGNHGTDVLVPLTPRARRISREGKIRKLLSIGIRPATARVAVRCQYGMEEGVVIMADALVEIARVVADIGNSRYSFARATGVDVSKHMSMPRAWAAWDIARQVNGLPPSAPR